MSYDSPEFKEREDVDPFFFDPEAEQEYLHDKEERYRYRDQFDYEYDNWKEKEIDEQLRDKD